MSVLDQAKCCLQFCHLNPLSKTVRCLSLCLSTVNSTNIRCEYTGTASDKFGESDYPRGVSERSLSLQIIGSDLLPELPSLFADLKVRFHDVCKSSWP